jgi:hypothetical protein
VFPPKEKTAARLTEKTACGTGKRISPYVGITQIRSQVEAHSFLSARLRAPLFSHGRYYNPNKRRLQVFLPWGMLKTEIKI